MKPVEERYPDHQWLLKAGLATALLTGFGNAIVRTWDLFYDNWKGDKLFADLREERAKAKAALSEKVAKDGMGYGDISKEMQVIENKWSKDFNARLLKQTGIESEGAWGAVKGTWQRFNALGNHTRPKIVFSTVLTTAAAIGGYMLMNQNSRLKRDLYSMQDRIDSGR